MSSSGLYPSAGSAVSQTGHSQGPLLSGLLVCPGFAMRRCSLFSMMVLSLLMSILTGCSGGDPLNRQGASGKVMLAGAPLDHGVVGIMPYIDQGNLYQKYEMNRKYGIPSDTARYNHAVNLPVTRTRLSALTCPSDTPNAPFSSITSHSYAVNFGNTGYGQQTTLNGVTFGQAPFALSGTNTPARNKKIRDITDGTSTTMLVSEVLQGSGSDLRGFSWWGDASQFTTYLPPNSAAPDRIYSASYCNNEPLHNRPCAVATTATPTMFASRSSHVGGVQTTLCDGSTRFVSENIDLGV